MFFTYEDYKKIEEWLKHRTVKDSQFEEASSLDDCDKIPILQDGKNKTIHFCELIEEVEKKASLDDDQLNKLLYDITFGENDYYDYSSKEFVQSVSLNYGLEKGDTVTYKLPLSVSKDGVKLTSVDEGGELYGISTDPTVPDKTGNDITIEQTFNNGEVPESFEVKAYVKIWPGGDEAKEIIVETKRVCTATFYPIVVHNVWLNDSGTIKQRFVAYETSLKNYNYQTKTFMYAPDRISSFGDTFEIYVAGDKGEGNIVVQTLNNGAYEAINQGTMPISKIDANYVGTETLCTKYCLGDKDNPLHLDNVNDLTLLITI